MINTYYICTDEKAYEYALRHYKDKETEILRCTNKVEQEKFTKIGFKNQDKVFYFFGKCNKGYLKADMAAIANRTEDFCELIAIPHLEKISKVTHKPLEVPFVYPLVFARLNLE